MILVLKYKRETYNLSKLFWFNKKLLNIRFLWIKLDIPATILIQERIFSSK